MSAQDFGMDSGDEDDLVVGAVEVTDPPAFGQAASGPPEEVMLKFFTGELFEAEDLAALKVDSGHDVADRAVFAAGSHALKDDQQRPVVGRIVQPLQRAQFIDVFLQLFVVLEGRVERFYGGGYIRQLEVSFGFNSKSGCVGCRSLFSRRYRRFLRLLTQRALAMCL